MNAKCCLILLSLSILTVAVQAVDLAECLTDSANVALSVPKTGLVNAVVVSACGADAASKLLPDWYDDICSVNDDFSIANYFNDISFGNHTLNMIPYGKTDDSCFVASINYINSSSVVSSAFWNDIMAKADAKINFAHFDNDGNDSIPNSGDDDGKVDFLFFVVVNHGGGNGVSTAYNYTTSDAKCGGGFITVQLGRAI